MKEIGRLCLRAKDGTGIVLLQLGLEPGVFRWASELRLEAEGLESWTAAELGRNEDESLSALCLIARFAAPRERYELRIGQGPASVEDHTETRLEHGQLTLDLLGFSPALRLENRVLAELKSDLRCGGRRIAFDRGYRKLLHLGGQGRGLRLCGVIRVPEETAPGSYLFDFFHLPGLRCLFVRCVLQYPAVGGAVRYERVSPFRWEVRGGRAAAPAMVDGSGLYAVSDRGYLLLAGSTPLAGCADADGENALLDPLGRGGAELSGAREQALLALFAGEGELSPDDAVQAAALVQVPELLEYGGVVRPFSVENYRPGKAEAAPDQRAQASLADRLRRLLRRG